MAVRRKTKPEFPPLPKNAGKFLPSTIFNSMDDYFFGGKPEEWTLLFVWDKGWVGHYLRYEIVGGGYEVTTSLVTRYAGLNGLEIDWDFTEFPKWFRDYIDDVADIPWSPHASRGLLPQRFYRDALVDALRTAAAYVPTQRSGMHCHLVSADRAVLGLLSAYRGVSQRKACNKMRMMPYVFSEWRRKADEGLEPYATFVKAWDYGAASHVDFVHDRVTFDSKDRMSATALRLLELRYPGEYSRAQQISQTVTTKQSLESLTDDELDTLLE